MFEKTYDEIVANAEIYKKIGMTSHYLFKSDFSKLPWDRITSGKPGGSHRLECATEFMVTAQVQGLEFHWHIQLEVPEANGHGHYKVDLPGLLKAKELMKHTPAYVPFVAWLKECSVAIEENATKMMKLVENEYAAVYLIRSLL